MYKITLVLLFCAAGLLAQGTGMTQTAGQGRPSGDIPPNLGYYTLDPLYKPDIPLGWAEKRIEERLDRGLVAVPLGDGRVYLGWRLLKEDGNNVAFNAYRITGSGQPRRLNDKPISRTTDFVDQDVPSGAQNAWFLRAVVDGKELANSEQVVLPADAPAEPYKAIDLKEDVAGVAMVGIGDLDGDGTYDFVVKHPGFGKDPGRVSPNRGSYKYDAYNGKTGAFMWRIDLGWNVDMGIWWTPMIVRDLDGDNKAEVCVRGSTYAATQEQMLPSGRQGFLLDAPEFLIVYDGSTGQEIDRTPWIELGQPRDWGDYTGNRASRHMLAVAYLDGKTPAVLAVRGTYGLMKVDAYVLKDRKLVKVWRWTNEKAPFLYHGQGQHSMKTADIDGDGCDEILDGSVAIDNDGRTMWSTGYGHGDRFYLGDIDPDRPGLEVWYIFEDPHPHNGASLWDAKTGNLIWGIPEPSEDNELGETIVGDIDPNHPGMEMATGRHFYTCKGQRIAGPVPPQDFLIWWDADLLREIYWRGRISKWGGPVISSIPGRSHQIADILGDWREEVVVVVGGQLRIYTTTIPASDRRVCLMQDPLYRNDVTHRSMGYPHYPMTSYYIGTR